MVGSTLHARTNLKNSRYLKNSSFSDNGIFMQADSRYLSGLEFFPGIPGEEQKDRE